MEQTTKQIKQEAEEALSKYGHFNSTHEVYGVLAEEVDEFWDLVRVRTIDNDSDKFIPFYGMQESVKRSSMINELTQIAAIATRAIEELKNNQIKWI